MTFLLREVQVLIALGLFLMGMITFWIGVYMLLFRSTGKEVRTLAVQTTRLAQKGSSDEIAGLVGNAALLLTALNDLVRTTTGIGVFLTICGLGLMASAVWFVVRLST
jgi:hypothetical protein